MKHTSDRRFRLVIVLLCAIVGLLVAFSLRQFLRFHEYKDSKQSLTVTIPETSEVRVTLFDFPQLDLPSLRSERVWVVPGDDMKWISLLSGEYREVAGGSGGLRAVCEVSVKSDGTEQKYVVYWELQTPLIIKVNDRYFMRMQHQPDAAPIDEPTRLYVYAYQSLLARESKNQEHAEIAMSMLKKLGG